MMMNYIIDHKVIQHNKFILLIINSNNFCQNRFEISIFIILFLWSMPFGNQWNSKITSILINLGNFFWIFHTIVCEWTRHTKFKCFSYVLFTFWKICFHWLVPNSLIYLDFGKNLILNIFVEIDFLHNIFIDFINVPSSGVVNWFAIINIDEWFLEHGLSIVFILRSKCLQLESTYRFDQIINIYEILLFQIVAGVNLKIAVFLNINLQCIFKPII